MTKITDGGDAIVEEIERLRSLYSGNEYYSKLKEYLDTLGYSSEPRDMRSSKQLNIIKKQLKSTHKGSKQFFKYLLELIDNDFNQEELLIILEEEKYLKEFHSLKENDFDLDSMFKTFISLKDNNFFNEGINNDLLSDLKGLNNKIKKGEIIELFISKPSGDHKYSDLFTGQLNNGTKMVLNDFFYENYAELDSEKRISIVENLLK